MKFLQSYNTLRFVVPNQFYWPFFLNGKKQAIKKKEKKKEKIEKKNEKKNKNVKYLVIIKIGVAGCR